MRFICGEVSNRGADRTTLKARAVVARAPPEILDPGNFGANTKAM